MLKRSILSLPFLFGTPSIADVPSLAALVCHFGEQQPGLIFATGATLAEGFINEYPVEILYIDDGMTLFDTETQTMLLIKEKSDQLVAEGLFQGRAIQGGCLDFGEHLLSTTEALLPELAAEVRAQADHLELLVDERNGPVAV